MAKTTDLPRVLCKVESINASRQQFKPYSYNFVPENLYVAIDLDPANVLKTMEGNRHVVDLDGFTTILSEVAEAIDAMHEKYVRSARAQGKAII